MLISSSFFAVFCSSYITKSQRVWLWACLHTNKNCILTTSKLLWIWMSPVFFWREYCFLLLQKIAFSSCWLWSSLSEVFIRLPFYSFVYAIVSIALNETLLAWQDIPECCWSLKGMDCSGISHREVASPYMVSEPLSSKSAYHK